MRRAGVGHHHFGERIVLHLAEQMQAVEALQVVEAVAVLQAFHLHFEDEVEGGTEHAAEGQDLLRQTADPQVDVVEAGGGHAVASLLQAPVLLRKSTASEGAAIVLSSAVPRSPKCWSHR